MRIFIWDYQDNISTQYHNSGGAIAIAIDLKRARILLKNLDYIGDAVFAN